MSSFKGYAKTLKEMVSTPLTHSSKKPSMDRRKVLALICTITIFVFATSLFVFLAMIGGDDTADGALVPSVVSQQTDEKDGNALVIRFRGDDRQNVRSINENSRGAIIASEGTLVRARLLNSLETYDSVPVYAQVINHSLGAKFYGWTLLGEANSDETVDRVLMSFSKLKDPSGRKSFSLSGQTLSLDGTLGVRAEKLEGVSKRVLLRGAKGSLAGTIGNRKGDFSSVLLRALLSGLQGEMGSELDTLHNSASVLSLEPGHEFFIQLTDDFSVREQ